MSSTAHLLIAEKLLGFQDPGGVFTVMIQLGSIFAIAWLYRATILKVIAGLSSDRDARHFAVMIVVAVIPALVAGALFSKYVKGLYDHPAVYASTFIIGGVIMLLAERFRPAPTILNAEHVPTERAFGVGLCQALAIVPGVSRSGSTIVGGMLLGLDRAAAAEFSFFVAIPTMTAAFAKSLFDVRHSITSALTGEIAIGFVAAFIASLLVVRPFLGFVRRSGFGPFAWYRIVAGLVILGALAAGWH